jgi:hypothetical protein
VHGALTPRRLLLTRRAQKRPCCWKLASVGWVSACCSPGRSFLAPVSSWIPGSPEVTRWPPRWEPPDASSFTWLPADVHICLPLLSARSHPARVQAQRHHGPKVCSKATVRIWRSRRQRVGDCASKLLSGLWPRCRGPSEKAQSSTCPPPYFAPLKRRIMEM